MSLAIEAKMKRGYGDTSHVQIMRHKIGVLCNRCETDTFENGHEQWNAETEKNRLAFISAYAKRKDISYWL